MNSLMLTHAEKLYLLPSGPVMDFVFGAVKTSMVNCYFGAGAFKHGTQLALLVSIGGRLQTHRPDGVLIMIILKVFMVVGLPSRSITTGMFLKLVRRSCLSNGVSLEQN